MKKNVVVVISLIVGLWLGIFGIKVNKSPQNVLRMEAIIISSNDDQITLIDSNDIIYSFSNLEIAGNLGDKVEIEYMEVVDENNNQNFEIVSSNVLEMEDNGNVDKTYQDNGLFSAYYVMAYNKLKTLSLDEKIGQLILARCSEKSLLENLNKYKLSGYVFYESDFANKKEYQVKEMINEVQSNTNIPLLIAVDEEGGKVIRVSSNPNLTAKKFKSPRELYLIGGMEQIKKDTINKSKVLANLGINLNLAPVVDVSMDYDNYIYERTIGENTEITSIYAKTVINASKGLGVSYTLKHFPGYGSNKDTHVGSSISDQSYDSLVQNDLPPFESGIQAGAEAVLISHNIVNSIDEINPASLSSKVHNLLRNQLNFTGVIITDDIYMGAIKGIANAAVLAVLAGNNLIITTDYVDSINAIKLAVSNQVISEALIDKLAFRVLAWKYYKNLMLNEK